MNEETKRPEAPTSEKPQLRDISQEELAQILEAHRQWVESKGEEGEQADLHDANLERADLRDANLQGATLSTANLQGAMLYDANLRWASLQEAVLLEANLQGADLGGANLQGADFDDAKLQEANLRSAKLQGAHLRNANLQGTALDGANLQDTRLVGANLQGASFDGGNLHGADLSVADLQGALIGSANLQGADLFESNVSGANLAKAQLQGAELAGIKGLAEAKLQDANLEGATGLLGTEFGRADVTGAKLPEGIRDFKLLETVAETSKNARTIFFAMLLGCAYCWLTIATTTDERLLTNSATWPLPIYGTEVALASFYWVVPFALLLVYAYLHFYLDMLWKGLAGLPAKFPDGRQLDERAYPWLLNGLVRRHFGRLQEGRPFLVRLKEWTTIFLGWWPVPLTLLGFRLRYLPRHHWPGTWLHVGLLVAAVALGIGFYRSAARTLRGHGPPPFGGKTFWKDRRTFQVAGTALILLGISFGAIEGIRGQDWVPRAFETLGYSPFADLDGANLQGAKLYEANVQGANLRGANLQGADLRETEGLTQGQLDSACGDAETKLPQDMSIKPCPQKKKQEKK